MESFLASCMTAGATIVTGIFALFKNRQAEKYEHDNLHDAVNKGHEDLNNSLISKHAEIMANLKDVRDYTIRTESAKEEAYRNGFDLKNVMAQIQALAEANADSTMRLKEMQKDLDNCKETIEWQSKIIEDKDKQLNQLRRQNELLQKQIYSLSAQNHAGRDEEEFEL